MSYKKNNKNKMIIINLFDEWINNFRNKIEMKKWYEILKRNIKVNKYK
jgi:hypothetical protein